MGDRVVFSKSNIHFHDNNPFNTSHCKCSHCTLFGIMQDDQKSQMMPLLKHCETYRNMSYFPNAIDCGNEYCKFDHCLCIHRMDCLKFFRQLQIKN